MKFLTVFTVLCLVAYSTQTPFFKDCDEEFQDSFKFKACLNVECYSFKNESYNVHKVNINSCKFAECEEGQQYKGTTPGDEAAVYPGCCPTPICE